MRWLSRLTQGAIILIVAGGFVLWIATKVPSQSFGGSFHTYAEFRDGSRLAVGSPVVIAGVRVGVLEKLSIDGRLARVDMVLRDGLDLPVDSFASRRADSLFGDSYIEIIPSGEVGDRGRRLASGDPITHVVEGSSTDTVLRNIASELPHIDILLDIVHDGAIVSRHWVTGTLDDRLTRAAGWLNRGNVEDPLASVDHAMEVLEDASSRGEVALADARPEIARQLDRVDRSLVSARARIADLKTGIVGALHDARSGIDSIDPQIAQANQVMTAINSGSGADWKGTLGRLVNDPDPGDRLDELTVDTREAVASFNRLRTWLGMRIEYDVFSHDVRFYATAEIHAHSDKFYLFELERGPLGGLPSSDLSDAIGTTDYTRIDEIQDQLRVTAQYGKQIGRFSLRGGLKDSTVGIGADALFLEGRLKLSADVFGSFDATPRVKLAGALDVFHQIYVLAGVDDALNTPGYLPIESGSPTAPKVLQQVRYGRDWFFGTMLVLNDNDVAALLRVYGALLIGLM